MNNRLLSGGGQEQTGTQLNEYRCELPRVIGLSRHGSVAIHFAAGHSDFLGPTEGVHEYEAQARYVVHMTCDLPSSVIATGTTTALHLFWIRCRPSARNRQAAKLALAVSHA
jgi:hypothetical protein